MPSWDKAMECKPVARKPLPGFHWARIGLNSVWIVVEVDGRDDWAQVPGASSWVKIADVHEWGPYLGMEPTNTECRPAALDDLRKRAEQYYAQSYEIDHSDEYERDRLGHLAEGIEEAIEYIEAAAKPEEKSVDPEGEG